MRWKGGRRSSNVEDRRGQSAGIGGGSGSGLLGFIPMLVRSKTGRIILVVGVCDSPRGWAPRTNPYRRQ
jgi:predicted metalloprotease